MTIHNRTNQSCYAYLLSSPLSFAMWGTYEQCTGFLPAESSSLDSNMNGSESRTHWV